MKLDLIKLWRRINVADLITQLRIQDCKLTPKFWDHKVLLFLLFHAGKQLNPATFASNLRN